MGPRVGSARRRGGGRGRGAGAARGRARGSRGGAAAARAGAAGGDPSDGDRRPDHPGGGPAAAHPGGHREDAHDARQATASRSAGMTEWHVSDEVLTRYSTRPEVLDDATASSVEMHLLRCAACRRAVADACDPGALSAGWDEVADRIDAPSPTIVERLLRAVRPDATYGRLVAATPALRLSTLLALVAVVGVAVRAAAARDEVGPFLVVAPIAPLGLIAATFAPGANPGGEAASVAPLTGLGLVLRRAVAVLVAGLILLTGAAFALPSLGLVNAAWLMPALGLSLGALGLATWIRAEVAAASLAGLWLLALWLARARLPGSAMVADLAPLAAPGQIAGAALAVAAIVVLVVRRDELASL